VSYGRFFTTMNANAVRVDGFVSVTTTRPAKPVPGLKNRVESDPGAVYQQTAAETTGRFWLGGSEHSFFDYARSDFSLVRGRSRAVTTGPVETSSRP
jgi:hypothetical protein